jgi:succinoglycan biosynthesis protein ExoM
VKDLRSGSRGLVGSRVRGRNPIKLVELDRQTATSTCAAPRVAICVLTYRRPAGLARLLGALRDLRLPDEAPEIRVVVVDNDSEASARGVCDELAARLPFPLRYLVEKRRGIPQARNAALGAVLGTADFAAFLDDDEVPEPDWLAELLRVQRLFDADAVTGPCLSRFETPPPRWIEQGGFFERPRWPTGSPLHFAFTGNVLVRAQALAAMEALFDERLALTGSEDSEFFQRFARAGHRIVWCDTAVIHDSVPKSCANLAWILARAYRAGAAEAYIERKLVPGPASALRVLAHGAYCIAKGSLQLAGSALRGRAAAAAALRLASFGAGRLGGLVGLQYAEYRRTHGD